MVDCSRFHSELVELLASDATERPDGLVGALRRHAGECNACSGSSALLEWTALGPSESENGPEAGEEYWAEFDERLHRRIGAVMQRRRARTLGIAAAAAAIAAAAVLATWISGPGHVDPAAVVGDPRGMTSPRDLPMQDEDLMDAEGILSAYQGWDGFDLDAIGDDDEMWVSEGALFPDTADLDSDTRRRLLDWLGEQESRFDRGPA